jgi:hypothetical protein
MRHVTVRFENCVNLTYLFVPDGVMVDQKAFSGSGLVVLSVAGESGAIDAKALVGASSLWVVQVRGAVGQGLCAVLNESGRGDQLWILSDGSAGYSEGDNICGGAFVVHLGAPNATVSRTPLLLTKTFSRSSPFSSSRTFSPVATAAATLSERETPAATPSERASPPATLEPQVVKESLTTVIAIAVAVPVVILIAAGIGMYCWIRRRDPADRIAGWKSPEANSDKDVDTLLF